MLKHKSIVETLKLLSISNPTNKGPKAVLITINMVNILLIAPRFFVPQISAMIAVFTVPEIPVVIPAKIKKAKAIHKRKR